MKKSKFTEEQIAFRAEATSKRVVIPRYENSQSSSFLN